jgi:ABC-type multidrug transport system ATPase subunit
LHGFYTAQSYLKHYDRLTTGLAKGGKSQKEIDGILKSLGILEDRQHVAVGDLFRRGLSEGEQRRLDLGLMVLGAPDTLFCEEPTGNLDSETSSSVMEFLKGYSSQPGRRVIVTINKPSSFTWNLIDNVILVAQGRVIYEGPRFDMESFFAYNQSPTPKRFSPVEHYLSVVSSLSKKKKDARSVEEWAESFKKWQEEADEDGGDMLGDDIETCFPTAITTVQISRGAIQKSKYLKKYHVMLELIKRYFLDLFRNPGILWVRFGMYFMVPMAKFHAPFKFFLDMLLSLNCAEALAQMVTLLVSNYIIGIVGLAGLFGFFMLLMGFMLVPSEFPIWLRWAYNVPFHTYTWRSFMYIEFSGPENVFDSVEFPTGIDVLRAYEIDNVNYGHDMLVLVGYGIIIHLISASIILVRQRKANRIEDDMAADEEAKDEIGLTARSIGQLFHRHQKE